MRHKVNDMFDFARKIKKIVFKQISFLKSSFHYMIWRIKKEIDIHMDGHKKLKQNASADDICLISIVMPVYNAEKYLAQSLDSLLGQTLKHFELICVDDGSTDYSLNMLRVYAKHDDRVKVLMQKNSYAGVARNHGMKYAQGKYILFLDADDFFEADLLEQLYKKAEETHADITICGADQYITNLNIYNEAHWELDVSVLPKADYFQPIEVKEHIFTFCTGVPWNKLFRCDYIKSLGIQYQTSRCANDLYFVMSALFQAERIAIVPKTLVHYRIGMGSNLQSNSYLAPFAFCDALQAIQNELINSGQYETFAQSFVNLALNNCMYNLQRQKNHEQIYLNFCKQMKSFYFPLFHIDVPDETYYFNAYYLQQYKELLQSQFYQEL